MAEQIGTVTLDLYARPRGTEEEFLIGELEIPIHLDAAAVIAGVTEAIEQHRPTNG